MDPAPVVWFTGLSGAGKTTVARGVQAVLQEVNCPVEHLDGDEVRRKLNPDLGFSRSDRDTNLERVAYLAERFSQNGIVTLCSFVSPYRHKREQLREQLPHFVEVYCRAPLEVVKERDVKGLYARAEAGEITNFTGISAPYEEPLEPDLVLPTDLESPAESIARVVQLLVDAGVLKPHYATLNRALAAVELDSRLPRPHGNPPLDEKLLADQLKLNGSQSFPVLTLTSGQLADLELIAVGAYSPLDGFMDQANYMSVVRDMRLTSGTPWPLPLGLAVEQTTFDRAEPGQRLVLADEERQPRALLLVTDKYTIEVEGCAEAVFGTTDREHPGVRQYCAQGSCRLGGPIMPLADRSNHNDPTSAVREYVLTPEESRQRFQALGWHSVVGFQTRNAPHRAHEYLQRTALETADGLFLHPLTGHTRAEDLQPAAVLAGYRALIENYYPRDRVVLAAFPSWMRYAGPREALFHAICRRNYGCTHFIVGRDHAGAEHYYDPLAAHDIFDRFTVREIGIAPLLFDDVSYCLACDELTTPDTCPHLPELKLHYSGTHLRELLRSDNSIPSIFMRPEVASAVRRLTRSTN
jgi:sulfate adenylyltransferase/3'-phosphoadenosine 5'-phosphosulfate synthase